MRKIWWFSNLATSIELKVIFIKYVSCPFTPINFRTKSLYELQMNIWRTLHRLKFRIKITVVDISCSSLINIPDVTAAIDKHLH